MRVSIFPFDEQFLPVLRHIKKNPDLIIEKIYSPYGWGWVNQRFTINNTSIKVDDENKIVENKTKNQTLLIPEFKMTEEKENYIYSVLQKYLYYFAEIINYADFKKKHIETIEEIARENNIRFINNNKYPYMKKNKRRKQIPIPMIVVMGTWESTDKYEIGLQITEALERKNISVALVGGRKSSRLLNHCSIPWDLLYRGDNDEEIIFELNQWFWNLAVKSRADVIVLIAPGEIQSISEKYPGDYGTLSYIIGQAIDIDYLVMSTFFCANANKVFEDISDLCEKKYGKRVDFFHLSNLIVDLNSIGDNPTKKWEHIPTAKIKEARESFCNSVTSIYIENAGETIVEDILKKLT